MKKTVISVCAVLRLSVCFGLSAHAANPIKVDVLYMNHGPLMDTVNKIKGVFSGYGRQADRLLV